MLKLVFALFQVTLALKKLKYFYVSYNIRLQRINTSPLPILLNLNALH